MSGLAERGPGTKKRASHGPKPAASKPEALPASVSVSAARAAAFELLERVGATTAHSDDLLHGPRLAGLSQPDKDLTTALVLGVLRWQIALDARLRPLLSRPDADLAMPVALALRLGAFQLLHLERVPPHAVLNESVNFVRAAGHGHAAGMVNAVLRALQRSPAPRRPMVEPLESMAERLGHPFWLVQRWVKAYGRAAAEAICTFDQQPPSPQPLFAHPGDEEPSPVMDAGSRLVAELAAASRPEAQRVWDCCAAPGGKTVVLGQRLPAASLMATDVNAARARRLEERLRRELPGRVPHTRVADAAAMPSDVGTFDLILCDVPCSGTGTLGRNPEIRHRLAPADLRRQADRQITILKGALGHLAPGGRLLYSTCSLEGEECEAVIETVLQGEDRLRLVPMAKVLGVVQGSGRLRMEPDRASRLIRGDYLRTLPGSNLDADGFFAAVVERDA